MNDLDRQLEHQISGESEQEIENAVLVSVVRAGTAVWQAEDHLDELAALADTAGAREVARVMQPRMKPDPATYVGKGKVSEIATLCTKNEARLIIFDDDLSPVQVRNLEKRLKRKVVDRSGLILDIFASRAKTKEARVQVELAQLEYNYPRLTKMWGHLKGQQGGVGFRGPGETQLEVDRRAVQRRISKLKRDLEKIAKQRSTRRKGRKEAPTAALIGYTNVGKSTLLNSLSGKKDAFVENRLFATLDSKVRRVEKNVGHPILLIDTVGFIRKLPHHLVASFRSTLEEARDAEVLVHVADLSHPGVEEQIRQTEKVLKSLEMDDKPVQLVFNKIDQLKNPSIMEKMRDKYTDALFISAAKGLRLWELYDRLESMLYVGTEEVELNVATSDLKKLDYLDETIEIRGKEWVDGQIRIKLAGRPRAIASALKIFGIKRQ